MKKWLNIKPKVNDFSEDEVDTETESEDDGKKLIPFYVVFFLSCDSFLSLFDSYQFLLQFSLLNNRKWKFDAAKIIHLEHKGFSLYSQVKYQVRIHSISELSIKFVSVNFGFRIDFVFVIIQMHL